MFWCSREDEDKPVQLAAIGDISIPTLQLSVVVEFPSHRFSVSLQRFCTFCNLLFRAAMV